MKMTNFMKKILVVSLVAIMFVVAPLTAFAKFDFKTAAPSVFLVYCEDEFSASIGSGFAVNEKNIVTNAHVIDGFGEGEICVYAYSETGEGNLGYRYDVKVVHKADDIDLAVLEVKRVKLAAVTFAKADTIKEGDKAHAIGAPEGLSFTLTDGAISNTNRFIDGITYLQTDTAINHGNSGGPLFNDDGNVIGVNTLKIDQTDNLGFAIRVDYVIDYLDEVGVKDYKVASSGIPMWVWIVVAAAVVVIAGVVVTIILVVKAKKKKAAAAAPVAPVTPEMTPMDYAQPDEQYTVPAYDNMAPVEPELGIYVMTGSMGGAQMKMMAGEKLFLGKDPKFANLVFDRSYVKVSRTHCSVAYDAQNDRYVVVDLSSNGTYFENGRRMVAKQSTYVAHGEVIKLADDGCKIRLL